MAPPTPLNARSGSTAPPEISIIEEGSSFATAADGSDAEDEEGDDDDDADSTDPFVDLLIARHEDLRIKLFEAEKRAREIEAEVREEMANEMAERLAEMERRYTERLLSDAESNEDFFNAKIDLLIRANSSEAQRLRSRLDAALLATPRPGAGTGGASPRKQAPHSPLFARGDIFKTPLTGSAAMFKTPRLVLPGGGAAGGEEEEIEVESELATLADDSTGVTLADGSYSQDDESMSRSVYLQPGPLRKGAQGQAPLVMDTSEDELITSPVRPDQRGHEQQSISIDEDEEEEEEDSEDSEEEETDSNPDDTQEEDMKRKVTKEDLSFVADSEEDASMSTSMSASSQGDEDEDEDESQSVEVVKCTAKKGAAVARTKAAAPAAKPKARSSKASTSSSTSSRTTAAAAAKKPAARASKVTTSAGASAAAPTTRKSMPLRPSRASRSNASISASSVSPAKRARTTNGSAKGKSKVVEEDEEEDEEEEMVVLKDSPSKRKRLLHAKKSVNEEEMEVLAGA
jgi:kinesin family protein 20/kinesin family protein 23